MDKELCCYFNYLEKTEQPQSNLTITHENDQVAKNSCYYFLTPHKSKPRAKVGYIFRMRLFILFSQTYGLDYGNALYWETASLKKHFKTRFYNPTYLLTNCKQCRRAEMGGIVLVMTYESHFLKYLDRCLGMKSHHGQWSSILLHPANQKDSGTSKENLENEDTGMCNLKIPE